MILAKPLEVIRENFVGVSSYVERKFQKNKNRLNACLKLNAVLI